MSAKHDKWQNLRKREADLASGPIIKEAQKNRLYRDQIGPVDTVEELDMQINNLGPKDGEAERGDLNMKPCMKPRTGPSESKEDSAEQDDEKHIRPVPRP